MRLFFFFILGLIISTISAQVTEDFSDGDFTINPIWTGDTSKFTIEGEELRSNSNDATDVFQISTPSTIAKGDLEWRFRVNMRISTSGANYTDIYLMADNADLTAVANGYFLRIGNTKDEISLYKIVSGTETQLTDGTDNKTHNKNINVKVTKGAFGSWSVSADYSGGDAYEIEGTVVDNAITTSSYFGFYIKQSAASFHLKHFYDDIYVGPLIIDIKKPAITNSTSTDKNTIVILTDEAVSTMNTDFSLNNGYGTPDNITVDRNEITLTYNTDLINGDYDLTINLLRDLAGNQLDTIVSFSFFELDGPKSGEILITEIFADPTPPVGLPDAEYIEIYNASLEALELENCTFSDGGTPSEFPPTVLASGAYLIVTKEGNESLFSAFGDVVGLDGFPALNNGGDNLIISNATAQALDQVTYTSDYYKDDIKKQGGYALERIDFTTACAEIDNWIVSKNASGGTPATANSVLGANPDKDAPEVLAALITDPSEITISFTENPAGANTTDINNYVLTGGINTTSITQNTVENTLILTLATPLEANTEYTLTIRELSDCKGNSTEDIILNLVVSEPATKGDILINELLFNPISDGVDFIEIYNNSEKFIEPSILFLRYVSSSGTETNKKILISEIMYPHTYLALTSDTAKLSTQYPKTKNLRELESFISMSNDGGSLTIFDALGTIIDSTIFSEDQHFALLKSADGVSLERVSFDGSSTQSSNWQSASSSVGFATPGYQNSQFIDLSPSTSEFSLVSKTISPDSDGYQDFLALSYTTESGGTVLNGYVYNLAGKLVHHPFNNETLGTSGLLTWSGVTDNGTKASVGNYILLLESFTLDGKVTKEKLAFSIVGRF